MGETRHYSPQGKAKGLANLAVRHLLQIGKQKHFAKVQRQVFQRFLQPLLVDARQKNRLRPTVCSGLHGTAFAGKRYGGCGPDSSLRGKERMTQNSINPGAKVGSLLVS